MMKRRTLVRALFNSAVLLPLSGLAVGAQNRSEPSPKVSKPARLEPGMTIGVVAPAGGGWDSQDIAVAIETVESLGYQVKEGQFLRSRNQYLAGTDEQRAADVNDMFRDPQVDGIFCLRGGYGTMRILPYIDYQSIRDNPKVITGFSDITGLLNAIYARTGLVTFHGPVAHQTYSDYTLREFRKVMVHPTAPLVIGEAPPFETAPGRVQSENRITKLVGGTARGRLIGGNLSLISRLIGTPYEPDFRGNILILEDVREEPYRIDRMLTHMWLAGRLEQLSGVAIGKFSKAESDSNTFSVEEVLMQRFQPLGIPAIQGLMIGHVRDRTVTPIGVSAELDADAGTLKLLETAVL
jgi:muramoyltetrapeptide carboxypeptidase